MANRVVVTICGEDYTFVAEESPSYMQKVGAYIPHDEPLFHGVKAGEPPAGDQLHAFYRQGL